METKEIVKLVLSSTKNCHYTGVLSKKDNLNAAIDLAKIFKNFADTGRMDEAMDIESEQWSKVITKLEGMLPD